MINTLINTWFGRISVEDDRLKPLIERTIIMIIDRIVNDANDIKAVIKKAFNTLCSLDLYAVTIAKKIIDINIKNSTMTRTMNRDKTKPTLKVPETAVERMN